MRIDRPIIEMPRIVDVRRQAIDDLPSTLERLHLKGKGLMLVGATTMKIAGEKILEIADPSPYVIEPLEVGEATIQEAEKAIERIKEINADFVIAVGGGTKIDIAKHASYQQKIPFISVPTIASHDGIASSRASLVGMTSKHSFEAHSPWAVIGDVDIIAQAPRRFTISGCADIISNKTAVRDWQFANRMTGEHISQYALTLSELIANTMIESQDIIRDNPVRGAYTVLKGLITSSIAMCIAGSSRPASGAEHMISHKLDHMLEKPALHGEQCGIGAIISMYLHGGDWKEIKDALKTIGAPTTALELGISRENIINAVYTANEIRKERYTILSKGITEIAAEKALMTTGVIDR